MTLVIVVAVAAVAAVVLAAAGHALACWWWPFGYCRRCHGAGKRHSPSGRSFRLCPRCKGAGRRLRIGRRIWNHFAVLRREAR